MYNFDEDRPFNKVNISDILKEKLVHAYRSIHTPPLLLSERFIGVVFGGANITPTLSSRGVPSTLSASPPTALDAAF